MTTTLEECNSSIRSQLRLWICFALLSPLLSLLHPVAAKAQKEMQLADHAFPAAITNSDRAMVSQSLDPDFTWTDRTGKAHPKSEVVSSLALLARDATPRCKSGTPVMRSQFAAATRFRSRTLPSVSCVFGSSVRRHGSC